MRKKLKKKFNNIGRDDVSLFAFMTIIVLLVILLSSGLVVHAESDDIPLDQDYSPTVYYDVDDSYILKSDLEFSDNDIVPVFTDNSKLNNFSNIIENSKSSYTRVSNINEQKYLSQSNYLITWQYGLNSNVNSVNSFNLYACYDGSFIYFKSDSFTFYLFNATTEWNNEFNGYMGLFYQFNFNSSYWSKQYLSGTDITSIDGIGYTCCSLSYVYLNSNLPVYYGDKSYDEITSFDELTYLDNPNFNNSKKEEIENNMYLGSNKTMYLANTTFQDGVFTCYPDLNSTQLSGNFSFLLEVNSTWTLHSSTHIFRNPIVTVNDISIINKYSGIGSGTSTLNFSKTWSIPTSEAKSGKFEISLSSLNDGLYDGSNSLTNLAMAYSNTLGNYGFLQPITKYISNDTGVNGITVGTVGISYDSVDNVDDYIDFPLDGVYYDFKLYIKNNDSGETSNVLLDYLYQVGSDGTSTGEIVYSDNKSTSDIIDSVGVNGVIPNSYFPVQGKPSEYDNALYNGHNNMYGGNNSSSAGGSSSSSSGGAIGDNSQVVNIYNNDDDDKYMDGLINKLVPNTYGQGGLGEAISNFANTNGWLQLMKTSFSFVPSYVFDTLGIFIVSSLGLLGVALVISLIKNLL